VSGLEKGQISEKTVKREIERSGFTLEGNESIAVTILIGTPREKPRRKRGKQENTGRAGSSAAGKPWELARMNRSHHNKEVECTKSRGVGLKKMGGIRDKVR